MATPSGPRPGRLLAVALVTLIGLYAIMFGTGNTTPQLGLDLRGGTEVVLTPKLIAGHGSVTSKQLSTAVNIIRQRVNGLGVAESDVHTEGQNIVVDVPGKGRNQVLSLVGTTALLRFRHVLGVASVTPPVPATSATPTPTTTTKPKATPTATAPAKNNKKGTNGRAVSDALLAPRAATPSPSPRATPAQTPTPTPSPGQTVVNETPLTTLAAATAAFASFDCNKKKFSFADDMNDYMIACDDSGTTKYLLAPAKLSGESLHSASASLPQNGLGDWEVDLSFKGGFATDEWGRETAASNKLPDIPNCQPPTGCNAIAIVLDRVVSSAPRIVEPIYGGSAQITGNFSQSEANGLANVLKYGALPVQFERSQVVSVSATLGNDQLHAGLLAGAIGIGLVVLYSLIYYRGLGLVTIASLGIAGLYTYAMVCLLGAAISFTLTLAGIAGLIVAIGITADSFVVYFERLRDEVREGRSLRSSAERGWARAIKTILAADFVSFLAAAVLYLLSIGSVKGFAFTLGLSTLIDLFVVIFFTHPLITVMVRSRVFGSGRPWTGLSPDRLGAKPGVMVTPATTAPVRPHRQPRPEGGEA